MSAQPYKRQVDVCIGKGGQRVGRLTYVKDGTREYSSYVYDESWLTNPGRFEISSDLPLVEGHMTRRAQTQDDSCFHFAIADTEPDAWGCRVIARAHAKARQKNSQLGQLTAFDYLSAVDDFSRVGALRLRGGASKYLQAVEQGMRATPPMLELQRIYHASRAVEAGNETEEDLQYLQGKGTSLGGMRPKCTVLEEDGTLALGKFPSVRDTRNVTRAEVLALHVARSAGIDAASSRIVQLADTPIAVIRRFDRTPDHGRIHYMSAASMLQAGRNEDHSYTEVVDAIRAKGADPTKDTQQLWRRLVFNHLITNVDDHLQNLGFLYAGQGKWRLAPAFDLNPFPDKDRESKTWLSEDQGPIVSLQMLIERADYFGLQRSEAATIVREVRAAVADWRVVATSPQAGMRENELSEFAPAFEHAEMTEARG